MIEYIVVPLGELIRSEKINEEKLNAQFKKFSCHLEKDLEDFLVQKAITYERSSFGRTYLFLDRTKLDNEGIHILAFFTIAQTSIDLSSISKKMRRKMLGQCPGRDSLKSSSAYLIGQIGRCDSCTKSQLPGRVLLDECYAAIRDANLIVGGDLIILECREHMYEKFYKGEGFKRNSDELNEHNLLTLYKKINFNSNMLRFADNRHNKEGILQVTS